MVEFSKECELPETFKFPELGVKPEFLIRNVLHGFSKFCCLPGTFKPVEHVCKGEAGIRDVIFTCSFTGKSFP